MKVLNLEGQKFGKLTVIKKLPSNKVYSEWLCKCECGNMFIARGSRLAKGTTDNCGCERGNKVSKSRTKHGMKNTRFYQIWTSMKQRCTNPKATNAQYYHKKGIKCCEEWLNFENFYKDMYNSYFENAYIDRIDNDKNYCKDNCRWVTVTESNRNKKSTLTPNQIIEIRNSNKSRIELMKEYGVSYMTIKNILTRKTWKEI